MTTWNHFPQFAFFGLTLWTISMLASLFFKKQKKVVLLEQLLAFAGLTVFVVFMALLWINLERPPLRTLGETRLWYALFLPPVGLLSEYRWKLRWMRVYTLAMAALFVVLNLLSPETHDKTLAPALQSYWFVPHVIVYIVGYAFLGASAMMGFHGLILNFRKKPVFEIISSANTIATLGFVFINCGLLFGAFWAKEAWGHYWSWDPKETWAFLTWLTYLIYLHVTLRTKTTARTALLALTLAFGVLLICWFGVNYLPTANQSVHTYRT